MMIILSLVACGVQPPPTSDAEALRVVALAPALTEVVLALDGPALVGVDASSSELAPDVPKVGSSHQISAEGVLALAPDLVVVNERTGPPEVLEQIAAASVEVVTVPHERTVPGVRTMIVTLAEAVQAEPSPVLERFDASCGETHPPADDAPRVLFIYARGANAMHVAGRDTAADAMLGLAGLANAVTAYDGYKPFTPEAAVQADPAWVVLTTRGLNAAGGVEGLQQVPGLGQLEAVVEGRVAAVDDFALLAFGLDVCEGATMLRQQVAR